MADEKMTLENQQKEMLDAFRELAKEGNGSIRGEFRELLLNIGDALDGNQVEELMKEVSVSADGGISYDSFVDMLVTGYPALAST
ncbi:hypothetical protein [Streptomyces sp. NPDC049916]|uniref:hypothetical protein n=1 Tax=Streptomyces sp. NPDC049916 TaxID=3155156 RepID=UPI0034395A93